VDPTIGKADGPHKNKLRAYVGVIVEARYHDVLMMPKKGASQV